MFEFCNATIWQVIASSALIIKKWRFSELDYSSAYNDFTGFYNAPNRPNGGVFAALKPDGSIIRWGAYSSLNALTDSVYTKVYSNGYVFVALKTYGSLTAWGSLSGGGVIPTD